MQLTIEIKCPGCEEELFTTHVQDNRVHIMVHPKSLDCRWSSQKFRVDRLTGYAEPWPSVTEEEAKVLCSPEDATPTSTTTSAQFPPTATTKPTRLIPQATPAGGHGRTRRFPGRG